MMKRKRFGEGGGVREGRHSGISDDTRARAMAFVAGLKDDDEGVKTAPVRTPKAEARPLPKPKPKPAAKPAPKVEAKSVPKTEYAIDDMAYARAPRSMNEKIAQQRKTKGSIYSPYFGMTAAEKKAAQLKERDRKMERSRIAFPKAEEARVRKALSAAAEKDESRDVEFGDLGMRKGGKVKESKAMMGKELAFMKAKGAPKSMIKHEKAEMMGMKKPMKKAMGGTMKYAKGGGIEVKGKTRGKMC
jgi:hypothetical protein